MLHFPYVIGLRPFSRRLVDPEGLVWRAYYGDAISDHIPFSDVVDFAKDLCLDMPANAAV